MYKRSYRKPIESKPDEQPASRNCPTMAMTVDEMAQELHISRPTAYELVKQEQFPSFHIGNRILVNREGLQGWMDLQCLAPKVQQSTDL